MWQFGPKLAERGSVGALPAAQTCHAPQTPTINFYNEIHGGVIRSLCDFAAVAAQAFELS